MFDFLKRKKEAVKLPFATDIHCHIVPGVDDGAPDAATAAELIGHMQQWGIERIIASPHVTKNVFENDHTSIAPAMEALHAELGRRGMSIDVSHAAEYRIDELLDCRIAAGDLMLLPNDFILIENSWLQEPGNLDRLVFDLQVKGLHPILAHPERYTYYWKRRERYSELHNAGLLFQINVLSLAGAYDKGCLKMAEYLMEQDLVDFAGTDLHRASHVEAIDRYLCSSDARRHNDALKGRVMNDKIFAK